MLFDPENFYYLYLPVAELNINGIALIGIGVIVGIIAGMCGIGGSIILLPILIFLGIPIHIAVTTALNQVLATSFSASLIYARKNLIDYKLATFLISGGLIGIILGIILYHWCYNIGKLDIFVSLGFLFTLLSIGTFNAKEVAILLYYRYKKISTPPKPLPNWVQRISFYKTKFPSSKNKLSGIFPLSLGVLSGVMLSFMGLGGSLIMTPILLYIFGISSSYVAGTISFQMVFTTFISYYIHAIESQSIDLVLAIPLLIGTVFGSQIGAKIGSQLSQETFKIMIATVTLLLCAKIGFELFAEPASIYQIEVLK
ncbi:MAG: sulfite exporter TauE/SafE family protein [Candidatus Midichloria sp.]|uniref:Sulfite exporter TauE/SafE family protein n=1 Tax=Hyalomma marginatum TaxID=34627 RepID=A0A8S4C2A7_9ACAR|nr:sulfite exporter TauE/SafE family protein [Hyalomma marginatum]CAG7598879.1 sulfite exporter TauE/SafE family protein [Hyalomma marginatum]